MKSKPNAFIRTSVIAGHPGETQESFEKLVLFLEEFKFDRFNTFAYSNEETTDAYEMEQIEESIINRRVQVLGDIAENNTIDSLRKLIGERIEIVVEGESDEHEYLLCARPLNWAVDIDGDILVNDTNDLYIKYGGRYLAKITELVGTQLLATLVKPMA